MRIQETFEIKPAYNTGHVPGLVVVLDTLITKDPHSLVGKRVMVRTSFGEVSHLCIDEAKEHGPVNSLFFRNLVQGDIPLDAEIGIQQDTPAESPAADWSPTPRNVPGG
jgi:hypothetical protein